jgi:hypothetical protein
MKRDNEAQRKRAEAIHKQISDLKRKADSAGDDETRPRVPSPREFIHKKMQEGRKKNSAADEEE